MRPAFGLVPGSAFGVLLGLAIAALAAVLPPPAAAAPQAQTPRLPPPTAASQPDDIPRLELSLDRVRRMIREAPPANGTQSSLLRLEYYVEVLGRSPRIDLFKDVNLGRTNAVQYGGMTHSEFLRVTAPPWRRPW